MQRTIALVALASVLASSTSGCAMSSGARGTLVGMSVARTIAGVAVMAAVPVDADHDGSNESPFDDNIILVIPGLILALAGVTMFAAGLTAHTPPRREPPMLSMREATPAWAATSGAAQLGPLAPPPPLPEIAATPEVVRMGQQVRAAVRHGDCSAGRAMLGKIDDGDPAYRRALADGPVMAPCRPAW